jgi:hypothetical protein
LFELCLLFLSFFFFVCKDHGLYSNRIRF